MASIINASTTSTSGLVYNADASGVLQLQSNGVTGLTIDTSANVTANANLTVTGNISSGRGTVTALVLGTPQATTSGTYVDFPNIPSWVKRITVMFNGVSTNGTSHIEVRLGTSSGIVSSGYVSISSYAGPTTNTGTTSVTDGFDIDSGGPGAVSLRYGQMVLSLANSSTNLWVSSHTIGHNLVGSGTYSMIGGGSISLASTLTTLRLTTVNGTDTFDAGSVNIMYE